MAFKVLMRNQIDDHQWNSCINLSENRSVYALTWYLDAVTDAKWKAIVLDDYRAVMPVFRKCKFFIPYVMQPLLCQQLGIFSGDTFLSALEVNNFFQILKQGILKFDIMCSSNLPEDISYIKKVNHVIKMDNNYEAISSEYNRNVKRNINTCNKEAFTYSETIDTEIFLDFIITHDQTNIVSKCRTNIKNLIDSAFNRKAAFFAVLYEDNSIRAAAFFIEDMDRLYFLLCASDQRGKKTKAMYLLIDLVIKKYAGKKKYFDFTGSNISSIARRNLSFGSDEEIYFHLKWQRFSIF